MSLDSPSQPPRHDPADLTTAAADVRALAAEVWRRVEEWRNNPGWHDDETNRQRYDLTADAIAALDALPDSHDPADATTFAAAVRPITDTWRPNRAGAEQAIYAAVDRLRDATRRLTASRPADA